MRNAIENTDVDIDAKPTTGAPSVRVVDILRAIIVVIITIILDDGDVRLSILDKHFGFVIVVADVERALAKSARAGQMIGLLTRLWLRLVVSPSFVRTSGPIGMIFALVCTSTT